MAGMMTCSGDPHPMLPPQPGRTIPTRMSMKVASTKLGTL